MNKKFLILVSLLLFVSLFAIPVFAEDWAADGSRPIERSIKGSGEPLQDQRLEPGVYGLQTNILQIPASSFNPRCSDTQYRYSSQGYIYVTSVPTCDNESLWATVALPSGAVITYLDLYFQDTNPTYDITAYLRAYYGGDFWGTAPSNTSITSVSSYGSSGYGYNWSDMISHTVNNDAAYDGGAQYTVIIYTPSAALGGSLKFKAVDIWWHRQVSPAPGTASFSDVPTGNPFFQYVEALVASGITAGCGGGNYCPDAPLTRGQMAVFLSKALGLHWPY